MQCTILLFRKLLCYMPVVLLLRIAVCGNLEFYPVTKSLPI